MEFTLPLLGMCDRNTLVTRTELLNLEKRVPAYLLKEQQRTGLGCTACLKGRLRNAFSRSWAAVCHGTPTHNLTASLTNPQGAGQMLCRGPK